MSSVRFVAGAPAQSRAALRPPPHGCAQRARAAPLGAPGEPRTPVQPKAGERAEFISIAPLRPPPGEAPPGALPRPAARFDFRAAPHGARASRRPMLRETQARLWLTVDLAGLTKGGRSFTAACSGATLVREQNRLDAQGS